MIDTRARVVVVILTFNQRSHTLAALKSLKEAGHPMDQVVLVDNASTDGTVDDVAVTAPQVLIVRLEENLGCAGGRNAGVRRALTLEPDYLLFLDNDCFIEKETIPALVAVAGVDASAGIFTPKVLWWQQPEVLWSSGGIVDWKHGRTPLRGMNEVDGGQYDTEREVEYAPGGFTFFRAEVARSVGDIDPDYFIYYEDPDWCLRAREAGFSCRFVPSARVWHNASQSVGGSPAFYFYRARNRLLFMRRNAPTEYGRPFWRHYWRDTVDTYYLLRRTGQAPQARAVVQGVRAYFRQQWGAYPGQ